MNKLFKYKIRCWYRYGIDGDEKEYMMVDVIAKSDQIAIQLAKESQRFIFSAKIESKEPYVENN